MYSIKIKNIPTNTKKLFITAKITTCKKTIKKK